MVFALAAVYVDGLSGRAANADPSSTISVDRSGPRAAGTPLSLQIQQGAAPRRFVFPKQSAGHRQQMVYAVALQFP